MCTRSTVERARTHPALLLLLSLWWLSPMVQHNTKARYVSHPHNLSIIHFKVILPSLSLSHNCVSTPHHTSVGTSRYPIQPACPAHRGIICITSVKMWHSKTGRSQWPRGLRRGSTVARLLGLEVRIPPGAWTPVSCECCVLSGTGLCVGLIAHPEQSYWVWCVCHRETSIMRNPRPIRGCCAMDKKMEPQRTEILSVARRFRIIQVL